MEKILVTSALPYANGRLHIGHVAGAYLPADIYVRYQKLLQNDVIFICGTDEHGAPISIKAEAEGISPRQLVNYYHESMKKSFAGLNIDFDNFSGTAREKHHKLSQRFFLDLFEGGYVNQKKTKQFYDKKHNRFLADRYVEGICPFCKSTGARGDQCDACGKLIDVLELIEPKSKVSGETPIVKETTHWYLNLPKFKDKLEKWLETKSYWKDNVLNFIMSWLREGLRERAISRDIDWGVPVPLDNADGKVLYVWFDAPIGYISSTVEWAEKIGEPEKWKDYWFDENTKLIHFIGKDNIPFHTIIWPAVLMGQKDNYVLPYDVPANEYLNIKGQKTSTSRDHAVWVEEYLKNFDGEYLRYVLAANAPETKDSDFSWEDFQNKVNIDLANILGNLTNRVCTFSKKYFSSKITRPATLCTKSKEVLAQAEALANQIGESYADYRVRRAAQLNIDIARLGNRYFDETKPWAEVKDDKAKAEETLFVCLEILRMISITFAPILPIKMKKLRKILNLNEKTIWQNIKETESTYNIGKLSILFKKIDDKDITEQNKQSEKKPLADDVKPNISFEDFKKLDLRVVTIISAEKIKKSNKLIRITVKLDETKTRTVVAGIAETYKPEDLIGKKVVMLVNLEPKKMLGIKSEGMILAAETDGTLSLLSSDKVVPNGSEVS